MKKESVEKALKIISSEDKVSAFGLVDSEGFPFVSSVVCIKNTDMNEFWISTSPTSRKAMLIGNNNKAGLCYNDRDSNITLMGTARVVTDSKTKKELWLDWMKNFFTDGPDDSAYCLIKFTAQRARLCIDGETEDFRIGEIEEMIS